MKEIENLQTHLYLLRSAVGWSAEELGERIGVTRQTINNLEAKNPRSKMTKTQYIAIRTVLEAEMHERYEDTKIITCLLDVLVDNPDNYDENTRQELLSKASLLTPAILVDPKNQKKVSDELLKIAATLGIALAGQLLLKKPSTAILAASSWLTRAITKKLK